MQGKQLYFWTDLFFKLCLCCSYISQWKSICSGVCSGKLSQGHLLSFLCLNLCRYVLNFPCPVMNWVVKKLLSKYCVHFCRSIIVGKNFFVWHPFSDVQSLTKSPPAVFKGFYTLNFNGFWWNFFWMKGMLGPTFDLNGMILL